MLAWGQERQAIALVIGCRRSSVSVTRYRGAVMPMPTLLIDLPSIFFRHFDDEREAVAKRRAQGIDLADHAENSAKLTA